MADLTNEEKREIKKEVKQVLQEEIDHSDDIGYIAEEQSLDEKISEWFSKITLLSLDDERKQQVAQDVKTDAK